MPQVAMIAFSKDIAVELEAKAKTAWEPRKYPLSAQQQAVADWTISGRGHCIVQAKPGSGKSSCLIGLLPYICQDSIDVTTATLHSVGFSAWKMAKGRTVKVDGRKVMGILNDLGTEKNDPTYRASWQFLVNLVEYAKTVGFGLPGAESIDDLTAWDELAEYYSLDANGLDPEPLYIKAADIYTRSLKMCNKVVDFSDMLLAPLYYKVKFPEYDWVLLDEAQDASFIKQLIATSLLGPRSRMVAVGDSLQALFSFIGSSPKSMEELEALLRTKTNQEVSHFPLSVSYRLPKTGVAIAKYYAPDLEAAPNAIDGIVRTVYLTPTNGQPAFWDQGPFGPETVILCRNNRPLVELAYAFLKRRIPAYIEGRDFGQGLAALAQRWKTITRLDKLAERLEEFKDTEIARLEAKGHEAKAAEVADRIDTLQALIDAAIDQGGKTIADLLAIIGKMFENTEKGKKPNCVTLSSVHRGKGREWDRVILLGRNKYMPSKWSRRKDAKEWEIEGERCCIFVALTRHKKELIDVVVPEDEGRKRRGKG